MDLKEAYKLLYDHWLMEFEKADVTQLTKEVFNDYKNALNLIDNSKFTNEDKIKEEIIKSYQENFKFLINDFLKIREIKILNSALALREINLNHLLESERMFYQNLVSTIKGFEKVKAISNYENSLDDDLKSVESIMIKNRKNTEVANHTEKNLNYKSEKENQYNYSLIRFLKKTPALVGMDLKSYGPFEKEDIAYIPYENAKILLYEKFAHSIEPSK